MNNALSNDLRQFVLIAVQQALVGNVHPNMCCALVNFSAGRVELVIVLDGPPRPSDYEHAGDIETELVAMFPTDFLVQVCLEQYGLRRRRDGEVPVYWKAGCVDKVSPQ